MKLPDEKSACLYIYIYKTGLLGVFSGNIKCHAAVVFCCCCFLFCFLSYLVRSSVEHGAMFQSAVLSCILGRDMICIFHGLATSLCIYVYIHCTEVQQWLYIFVFIVTFLVHCTECLRDAFRRENGM